MGFMNYYLSIGFAFLALALAWRGGAGNWLGAAPLSAISLLAPPIGVVLFVALGGFTFFFLGSFAWGGPGPFAGALAFLGLQKKQFFAPPTLPTRPGTPP